MTTLVERLVQSPLGQLRLVATGKSLIAVYFQDHIRPLYPVRDGQSATTEPRSTGVLDSAERELEEYFSGRRRSFTMLRAVQGTAFQMRVWAALTEIPCGETRSYSELAIMAGYPGAARAVGAANARNPHSIVVPCHRVIGANGSLTGYAGGNERKQWLLEHERA